MTNAIKPSHGFWVVNLELFSEDENGKVKRTKEVHLVDAETVAEAESKVKDKMSGSLSEYVISCFRKSAIGIVY